MKASHIHYILIDIIEYSNVTNNKSKLETNFLSKLVTFLHQIRFIPRPKRRIIKQGLGRNNLNLESVSQAEIT